MELNADLDPDLKHWGTGGVGVVDSDKILSCRETIIGLLLIIIILASLYYLFPWGAKSIYQEHNLSLLLLLGQQSIIGPGI